MLSASFILKKTNIQTGKQLLFYLTSTVWVFSYTLLTLSISLLLSERLSIFFIGLFISITNFLSIFADIPIGFFQKIVSQRTLLLISIAGLIVTTSIFLGGQAMMAVTFLAVLIHGLSHDLYDITMLTYIFQNSHPENYSQDISQKNVAEALGLLGGLVIASLLGFTKILFDPLWFALIAFITAGLFILFFFNKTQYDVKLNELDTKMMTNKFSTDEIINNLKDFLVSTKNIVFDKIEEAKQTLKEKFEKKDVIILKPLQKEKFEQSTFKKEFKESIQGIFSIVAPPKAPLIWSSIVIGFFSFWDTFVATFLPIYIATNVIAPAKLSPAFTAIIMGVIVVPLFVAQVPFAKLADKFGRPLFMYIGIGLAAASIYGFTISNDVMWTILMGLFNALGYAAVFPVGQAFFAQRFQENFAILHNTQIMDSNISAGPLKMILNIGNVVGSLIGGALIATLGFRTSFFMIAIFLAIMFLFSIVAAYWVTRPIVKITGPSSIQV